MNFIKRILFQISFPGRMLLFLIPLLFIKCGSFQEKPAPAGLMTELLAEPELAVITNPRPRFSWIPAGNESVQSAYQILVSSSRENLQENEGDLWNPGKTDSGESVSVPYAGKDLKEHSTYWWKVRTWNEKGEPGAFSPPQQFNTGVFEDMDRKWPGESRWVELETGDTTEYVYENRHPIRYQEIAPASVVRNDGGHYFVAFEKAAFGALKLSLPDPVEGDSLVVHLGEDMASGNRVNRNPGGSITYYRLKVDLQPGKTEYLVQIPRFVSHYPNSQVLAEHMPEVTPFRYAEIEGLEDTLTLDQVRQVALLYRFDDEASGFHSSDENLNQIWELCKHTLKVTPFMGIYIDGGARERMPYEADAFLQQVSHYCVDREFAIQRYTTDFLIYNPSWPTEWHLHIVFMAWADYMATGDERFLEKRYDELKKKTLLALAREDGLISTRTGLVTPEFLESIHYQGRSFRDIVDWPQGTPANETKNRSGHGSISLAGETDRYVFSDINTVVNAYHYQNLVLMEKIATVLGKKTDEEFFKERAALVKSSFNEKLFDQETGVYSDGEGVEHSALHANMFPVAFGLAPEKHYPDLKAFLISRGMACSPAMSFYLFKALYEMGADDYALDLLTSESDRSWMNMIRFGTTITSEAWDLKYKRNMTWNHAWAAIPAYVIARKICGIEPIEPSFRKIRIKPHPGGLERASIKHPTIRGTVSVHFEQGEEGFKMNVTIPPNSRSDVYIPMKNADYALTQNGNPIIGEIADRYLVVRDVGPGIHAFALTSN